MRCALTIILTMIALSANWAAEVAIEGDPPLPVPNIIANPGLELGTGDMPDQWTFSTATPGNFLTSWRDDGRSGRCLWMKAKTGVMSGYFNQAVAVEPGRPYLFKGFYRLAGGKMLVYAHARATRPEGRGVAVDERFYRGTMRGHWLVPVFLPPDSLGGPDPNAWLAFRLQADIPDPMQAIALSLGLYFQAGEVSFDDLWVGIATTDLTVTVKPAAGETLARVVVNRVGEAKPVFDSGPIQDGGGESAVPIKQQPTDATYEAVVTLGDGRTRKCRYPEGEVE